MLKRMIPVFSAALLLPILYISALTQEKTRVVRPASASVTTSVSDREQSGLSGPVRRVETETAKLVLKSGKLEVGERVLQETTTYDVGGRRIDSAYYPVSNNSLIGKEEYKYDDKGNIVEMVVRDEAGKVLSKETYTYEFDAIGNWTKMVTAVAVVEAGKSNVEPAEVSYRTITYYFDEAIAKIVQPASSTIATVTNEVRTVAVVGGTKIENGSPPADLTAAARPNARDATRPAQLSTVASLSKTNPPADGVEANADLAGKLDPPARRALPSELPSGTAYRQNSLNTASGSGPELPRVAVNDGLNRAAAVNVDIGLPAAPPPPEPLIRRVTIETLKAMAISLPQPVYPVRAASVRIEGNVDVEMLVDESGRVSAAHVKSGHPLLHEAALGAVRQARFSPLMAASGAPVKMAGVITYEFSFATSPAESSTLSPTAVPGETKAGSGASVGALRAKIPVEGSPVAPKKAVESSMVASAEAIVYARKGAAFYQAKQYKQAIDALGQASRLAPENAMMHTNLAAAYAAQDNDKEAIDAFKEAIRLKPDLVVAHYGLGEMYYHIGRLKQAAEAYEQALRLKPGMPVVLFGLGVTYHNLGRYKDAVKTFEEAVILDSSFAAAHYGLSAAYYKLGERTKVIKQYKILKTLNSGLADRVLALIQGFSRPSNQSRGFN